MNDRLLHLLAEAARAAEELRPVDGAFLREHNITADECHDLCMAISASIHAFLAMVGASSG